CGVVRVIGPCALLDDVLSVLENPIQSVFVDDAHQLRDDPLLSGLMRETERLRSKILIWLRGEPIRMITNNRRISRCLSKGDMQAKLHAQSTNVVGKLLKAAGELHRIVAPITNLAGPTKIDYEHLHTGPGRYFGVAAQRFLVDFRAIGPGIPDHIG